MCLVYRLERWTESMGRRGLNRGIRPWARAKGGTRWHTQVPRDCRFWGQWIRFGRDTGRRGRAIINRVWLAAKEAQRHKPAGGVYRWRGGLCR